MNVSTVGVIILCGVTFVSLAPARQSAPAPLPELSNRQDQPTAAAAASIESTVAMAVDKPIEGYRTDLLDLAFTAVSAMPLEPHIRNRSRGQDAVVQACLSLDQPQRALEYIARIDNWQRGSAYADYALYCAQRGCAADLDRYLGLAASAVQGEEQWRRDLVRVKIAKTHVWLGQAEKAAALDIDLVDAEIGKINIARAATIGEQDFDELVSRISVLAASGEFDAIRNATEAYLKLLDRFYADEARRAMLEHRVRSAISQMPLVPRVEALVGLAGCAVNHDDRTRATEILSEAQASIDGRQWLLYDRMPIQARVTRMRWQAGDVEQARRDVDAALAQYEATRDRIDPVWRAETLCPIAETYQAMGETALALALYRRAVEEGAINPNSRPRSEDLAGTCCSMATSGVEPDEALWERIRAIRDGLDQPW